MTHETRPEFTAPAHTPRGKSPQRVIQRPRIPDPTWSRALTKAHRMDVPIGHVIGGLLDQWLEEDDPTGPDRPDHAEPGPLGPDRTKDAR